MQSKRALSWQDRRTSFCTSICCPVFMALHQPHITPMSPVPPAGTDTAGCPRLPSAVPATGSTPAEGAALQLTWFCWLLAGARHRREISTSPESSASPRAGQPWCPKLPGCQDRCREHLRGCSKARCSGRVGFLLNLSSGDLRVKCSVLVVWCDWLPRSLPALEVASCCSCPWRAASSAALQFN